MDTDDLSEENYKAIMIEAERFNHDLTLQFGLLSGECEDENDFIKKSEQLIDEMMHYDEAELDDLFFGNLPNRAYFHATLTKILDNIIELNKITKENRTYG